MSTTYSTNTGGDNLLAQPLQYVKGVGPRVAALLQRLDLHTLQDLLFFFPHMHKDRASITPIIKLKAGVEANIVAQIIDVRGRRFSGREKVEAQLQDESGYIRAGWWNPYVADRLTPNAWGFFSGKVGIFSEKRELSNPEFEILSDAEDEKEEKDYALTPGGSKQQGPMLATGPSFGRIVPIYNLRPKHRLANGQPPAEIRMTQNFLRKIVWRTIEAGAAERLADQLPESLRRQMQLMPLAEAVRQFHFPDSFEKAAQARRRLVFEELFVISLGVALRRAQVQRLEAPKRMVLSEPIRRRIAARLPFELTAAQAKALEEIARDTASPHPMNRLLQGDVGSGKTAVAVASLLLCVAHGAQAALLAPTEVLADQHMQTISKMLAGSKVNIGLLRGGSAAGARAEFLAKLAAGEIHIAIGTHALLEDDVKFKNLSLIVVDEQHKFGVNQRQNLRRKGVSPHVLVMTATPIPRTLTLTLYGDLDVSIISDPPPGRGEIVSKWVKQTERDKIYRLIVTEARKGHATYVVLPRIEEAAAAAEEAAQNEEASKKPAKRPPAMLWNEVKGAEAELKRLREHLPTLRIDLLHGRMASADKDHVLGKLREGKIDVLVSTQVIEVGIDLPNATIMVIENAELFGLSALHQLRGRVGRSERKSYCFVLSTPNAEDTAKRLKTFVSTRDGFEIAEADFELRGPGQFFGTAQSGMPELKVADLLKDQAILAQTREAAVELVKRDPTLKEPEHAGLKARVAEVLGKRLKLVDVG